MIATTTVENSSENSSESPQPSPQPCWSTLVEQIKRNEQEGMEGLYKVFARGVRYYLCRQLGPQDLEDRVHDAFLTVTMAIQRGELREPERLMGYVRTIIRRYVAAQIEDNVLTRRHHIELDCGLAVRDSGSNPEQKAMQRENKEIAHKVLKSIASRDREILIRFYLDEQPAEQICSEMQLTETQFRLLKSRAKARFGELGKRKVTRRPVPLRENLPR
jgi:RNA polymerase sigma-70 factor, ECF subfamily